MVEPLVRGRIGRSRSAGPRLIPPEARRLPRPGVLVPALAFGPRDREAPAHIAVIPWRRTLQRRSFLGGMSAFLAAPSLASPSPIAAVAEYEAVSGGHVGLYAENIQTRRKLEWRAGDRFVMCSTFKASLAACVLSHVDRGQCNLEEVLHYDASSIQDWHAPVAKANLARGSLSVREMCKAAVEESDNTCANILLALIGGPSALTAYWHQLGDRVSRLDDTEPLLNSEPPGGVENTTTPASMATILRHIALGRSLSPSSRTILLEWLIGCKTGSNRLRAGLPANWVIGNKTGSDGKGAAGDIALVWPKPSMPIVISVYTRGGSPTERQLADLFAGIARAVAVQLT